MQRGVVRAFSYVSFAQSLLRPITTPCRVSVVVADMCLCVGFLEKPLAGNAAVCTYHRTAAAVVAAVGCAVIVAYLCFYGICCCLFSHDFITCQIKPNRSVSLLVAGFTYKTQLIDLLRMIHVF